MGYILSFNTSFFIVIFILSLNIIIVLVNMFDVMMQLFWFYCLCLITSFALTMLCIQMFKEGHRILERQRFQFPNNWLYIDNVDGEWGAFSDIMKRRDSSIQAQVASLQMKIASEDTFIEKKTGGLLLEWEKDKPVAVRMFFTITTFVCLSILFIKKIFFSIYF